MARVDDFSGKTIHHLLKQQVKKYGTREFFRFKDQVFGFEDLDGQSDKLAAGLQALGVEKYRLREEGITPDTWDREKAGYELKR